MKAHYITNRSEQRKLALEVAKEEIERQKADVCPACEQNTANQVAAVICKALNTRYGFGKERLRKVITDAENLFELCAIDGKRFNAGQAVEWLRDAMGIDLERNAQQRNQAGPETAKDD